ncbi:hypothetical protein [Bacillus solimangrovi]|uniref:hypothetical protein n=1 Tax=Bacillus solimangrovi TaxID=1305675 RepID=UPI0026A61046
MACRHYETCRQYRGRMVHITDKSGRVHTGRIRNVDRRYVYLDRPRRGLGGYGYGYYGGYGGYGCYGGRCFGALALGAIAGIAIAGLLFW